MYIYQTWSSAQFRLFCWFIRRTNGFESFFHFSLRNIPAWECIIFSGVIVSTTYVALLLKILIPVDSRWAILFNRFALRVGFHLGYSHFSNYNDNAFSLTRYFFDVFSLACRYMQVKNWLYWRFNALFMNVDQWYKDSKCRRYVFV